MTQPCYDSNEKSSSGPKLEFPSVANEPRPLNLAVETTWSSTPTITVASEKSPMETDPEKQSPEAPPHKTRSQRARDAIRSLFHTGKIRLNDSGHGNVERPTHSMLFQACPRTKLENYPMGYSRLAGFQSSDEAFSIYRGFGYLHARVILEMQYEISDLEQRLMEVDEEDKHDENGIQRLISHGVDNQDAIENEPNACRRREIMTSLHEKLSKYDEMLLKAREMGTFQRPNQRDYNSVTTWFDNCKPLTEDEWYSLQQQDDMVTLRQGREWAMFDGWIESLLRKCDSWFPPIGWIFRPERIREQSSDEHIHYYHSRRVEGLVAIIITAIIFILLVLPVVLMYELTSFGNRTSTFDAIGVLVVFTLVFSAAMSLLTKAKRHELFGASAAYCAVLVVFISNFDGSSVGST